MSETEKQKTPSYDQSHRLRPLLFVTTIVSEGQSQFIVQLNEESEGAICCICRGKGTLSPELASSLSLPTKKDVVFSILRADQWSTYKEKLNHRFSTSKMAKGIAYCIPVDSVAGISIYKMLSNTRLFEKPMKAQNKKAGRKDS